MVVFKKPYLVIPRTPVSISFVRMYYGSVQSRSDNYGKKVCQGQWRSIVGVLHSPYHQSNKSDVQIDINVCALRKLRSICTTRKVGNPSPSSPIASATTYYNSAAGCKYVSSSVLRPNDEYCSEQATVVPQPIENQKCTGQRHEQKRNFGLSANSFTELPSELNDEEEISHGFLKGMTAETWELARTLSYGDTYGGSKSNGIGHLNNEQQLHGQHLMQQRQQIQQRQQDITGESTSSFWRRRIALSKAITLVESSNPDHRNQAALLLTYLLQQQQQSDSITRPQQQLEGLKDHGKPEKRKNQNVPNNENKVNETYNRNDYQSSSLDYFRVGIAGPPGAGKSTLIEALGKYVLNLGSSLEPNEPNISSKDNKKENMLSNHYTNSSNKIDNTFPNNTTDDLWRPGQLSVICIDPSSVNTGGSLLGDKTRMTELSRDVRAFVRPSPTKGVWGGLTPTTDDVIRVVAASRCHPLILLETVGLGQSELEVQQCVDMLILAVPPGGGDSLQGVKKGIVEIADMIIVTKADGQLLSTARHTAADYRGAMQFLSLVTDSSNHDNPYIGNKDHNKDVADGEEQENDPTSEKCNKEFQKKTTPILLVSAVTGDGLMELWKNISVFRKNKYHRIQAQRKQQDKYWMWKNLRSLTQERMEQDPILQQRATKIKLQLESGTIPPRVAASMILDSLEQTK